MKPTQPGLWLGEIFWFEMASHLSCNKKELTFDLFPWAFFFFHCLRAHYKRLRKILPIPRSVDMVSFNLHLSGSFLYAFYSFFPACHVQLCSPTPHHAGSPDTGELNIVGAHSGLTPCFRWWHCSREAFHFLIQGRKVKVSLSWAEHWKNHYGRC